MLDFSDCSLQNSLPESPTLCQIQDWGIPPSAALHSGEIIYKGWPDFFSRGPFSIIFMFWGPQVHSKGQRGAKCFENFSADL